MRDIGLWLMIGILIAGLIGVLVPETFVARYFTDEWASLFIMLLVGIPLYICASASTPIAAAMILKGLSPGAALVFLLAGPATNAATLTVITRYWGRQTALVYLAAIAVCSLVLGWLVNLFYAWSGLEITQWVHPAASDEIGLFGTVSAIVLLVLLLRSGFARQNTNNSCCPD